MEFFQARTEPFICQLLIKRKCKYVAEGDPSRAQRLLSDHWDPAEGWAFWGSQRGTNCRLAHSSPRSEVCKGRGLNQVTSQQPHPTLDKPELPMDVIDGLNCFYTKVAHMRLFPSASIGGGGVTGTPGSHRGREERLREGDGGGSQVSYSTVLLYACTDSQPKPLL